MAYRGPFSLRIKENRCQESPIKMVAMPDRRALPLNGPRMVHRAAPLWVT
jgi:hypothetical protein